jgi:hypothetical protein
MDAAPSQSWIDRFVTEMRRLGVTLPEGLFELLARGQYACDPSALPELAARKEYDVWSRTKLPQQQMPKPAWVARFALKLAPQSAVDTTTALTIAYRAWENMCVMVPEDAAVLYVAMQFPTGSA